MAGTFPRFRLYETDGITLVYEFDCVTNINDWQDPSTFVEHSSLRGQGSHISEGSQESWDLVLDFILQGDDYEDLVSQIESLQTAIPKFERFILKVDKTPSLTKDYKVMRVNSFIMNLSRKKKRVNIQDVQVIFKVDVWA